MTVPSPQPAELEGEIWRPAPSWPGYLVSNLGRVQSLKNPRRPVVKASQVNGDGREVVFLHDGRQHSVMVHRLVGGAFLGALPDGLETRHLDGDACNNRLSNLAYGTHVENEHDKLRHGTHHLVKRTHCPQGHPYDEVNTYREPKRNSRACRTCRRARMRTWQERRMLTAAGVRSDRTA